MGFLDRFLRTDPEERARFERAAAAVDRELAGHLELAAMFDQTHQAAVFENAAFAQQHAALRLWAPAAFAFIGTVYAGMPATESAMERRGPANTLRPEDLALIERWEGDVREAQRLLRAAVAAPPPSGWSVVLGRLRPGRRSTR
jgi:hypothetical protein